MLEGLTLFSKELKDFQQDVRWDLGECKTVVKQYIIMQEKVVDLKSRSRRNNLRIYGAPEDIKGSTGLH